MTKANLEQCFDDIRSSIISWITDLLAIAVVELEQGAPRPNPPFVGFKLNTEMETVGVVDEARFRGNDFSITGQRYLTISFEAVQDTVRFGNKIRATDLLQEVQFDLDNPVTADFLRAVGLSVADKGKVIDITKILETDYEPRAVLDVRFGIAISKTITMPDIGIVEIDGEIDVDGDGTVDKSFQITVEEP